MGKPFYQLQVSVRWQFQLSFVTWSTVTLKYLLPLHHFLNTSFLFLVPSPLICSILFYVSAYEIQLQSLCGFRVDNLSIVYMVNITTINTHFNVLLENVFSYLCVYVYVCRGTHAWACLCACVHSCWHVWYAYGIQKSTLGIVQSSLFPPRSSHFYLKVLSLVRMVPDFNPNIWYLI